MCGIFGFSGFEDPSLLKKMAKAIYHRGPDSEGFFSEKNFSMGMRRLSIIDLQTGDQPLYNKDKTVAICYNGEVYNFLELREHLSKIGHQFHTHSDTEVILHAYEEWGVDCLSQLNGMFAFAIYDVKNQHVFIARDRCGQKPFYFYHKNGKFVFSSEVKAILEADFIPREVNIAAIDPYLTLRYVPEPQTMFKDIVTLPAAHFLILNFKNEILIKRYWDIHLSKKEEFLTKKEAFRALEQQLKNSVDLVMRSDVPVGAYLSGGIDSSLLVALMAEKHRNINTYSIGFHSAIDETAEARETALLLGTKHHEIYCTPEDITLLPKVIYHMDRPVGDALTIAFYKLAEAVRKDVKVVISGEGADEIFAGYQFHKVMLLIQAYFGFVPKFFHKHIIIPLLNKIPAAFLNAFFQFPASLGEEGKQNFIRFLQNYPKQTLFENYINLKTLWREDAKINLYADTLKNLSKEWIPKVRDNGGMFLDRLLKLQWDEWLQDWAIIRQDKNSMAHSVEVRLPFLDHNLIELGFKIHPGYKANILHDKIIERKIAQRILPKNIVNRTKKPFYFPIDQFINHPYFKELIKLTLNKDQVLKRGYFDYAYIKHLLDKVETREFIYLKQIISLVVLELWHMIFIDKQIIYS